MRMMSHLVAEKKQVLEWERENISGLFSLKKKKYNESDDGQRQRECICASVLP